MRACSLDAVLTRVHRGANGHGTAGGGGGCTGGPIELQGLAGSHTRPARPPEASSAGPPEAYIFFGGSRDKEEPPARHVNPKISPVSMCSTPSDALNPRSKSR
jgi:hypothetical protein